MARIKSKKELLAEIKLERKLLEDTLQSLNRKQMTVPGVCARGRWSVKDILAHLVEWEQMFLGWYRAGRRGEVPKTPAPDLNWRQLPLLNQRIYEKHRNRSLKSVLADFEASHQMTLKTVRAIPEKEMFKKGRYQWLGQVALISYIGPNTCSHYRWARKLIQKWQRARVRTRAA
jgi:hypothetical protein